MSDNDKAIICPACGKPMKKIYIESAKCHVDICVNGCGGIYFDNREYKKMDENAEDIHEILDALANKEFIKADESKDRICPMCNSKMMKHYASAKHEIEIDDCYNCGAIFLDGAELIKIRAQFNTEQDRIDHFNKIFEELHKDVFVDMKLMDKRINQQRIERVQRAGSFVSKFLGL